MRRHDVRIDRLHRRKLVVGLFLPAIRAGVPALRSFFAFDLLPAGPSQDEVLYGRVGAVGPYASFGFRQRLLFGSGGPDWYLRGAGARVEHRGGLCRAAQSRICCLLCDWRLFVGHLRLTASQRVLAGRFFSALAGMVFRFSFIERGRRSFGRNALGTAGFTAPGRLSRHRDPRFRRSGARLGQ